eukprot:11869904-Ditylum_brightwellii.AAC.1
MSECKLEDPKKASAWRKLEVPEDILHYLKLVLKDEYSNEELSELKQLLLKHCRAESYDQLVRTEITRK